MRIQSFNSAISSVAKSARNTVAAAMVAASPMVAKAAAAVEPAPKAVTNVVEMVSTRNYPKLNQCETPYYYFRSYTNNLPHVSSSNEWCITTFKSAPNGMMRFEGYVPGYAPVIRVEHATKPQGPFTPFDTLVSTNATGGSASTATGAFKDTTGAGTKFGSYVDLDGLPPKGFFKFTPIAIGEDGKVIPLSTDSLINTKVTKWYDAADKEIK